MTILCVLQAHTDSRRICLPTLSPAQPTLFRANRGTSELGGYRDLNDLKPLVLFSIQAPFAC